MMRTNVVSSNIKSIGYDPAERVLEVEFKGSIRNKVWTYTPVSRETYDELIGADSIGRAFNALVKSDPVCIAADVTLPEPTQAL